MKKNKKKKKRIRRVRNKIQYLIMIFITVLVGMCCVRAEEAQLESTQIYDYYSYAILDGTPRLFNFKIYEFNGKPVYCIELGQGIYDYEYVGTVDYESLGYSKEQMDYVGLLAYYGYEYPGHQDNYFYYMATQELIWEYLSGTSVYWTQELNLNNPSEWTGVYAYKEEILNLVAEHSNLPTLAYSSFRYSVTDVISILDENGVLNDYEIVDDGGLPVSIVDNALVVDHEGKYVGDYVITLKRKSYLSQSSMIYYNDTSQKLFSVGTLDTTAFTVPIRILGASLTVQKYDAVTQSIVPFGNGTLSGAKYGIYNLNDELIAEFETDDLGQAKISNLAFGSYYVKELESSYGYELDPTIYSLYIAQLKNTLVVYEEPTLVKVLIYKTYDDDYLPESGVIFDILNQDGEVYATIVTDENGYASLEVPYGTYQIVQKTSKEGFTFTEAIDLTVDENSDAVITYSFQDDRISNPKTYDGIFIYFVVAGGSILGLFLVFLFFSKKNMI